MMERNKTEERSEDIFEALLNIAAKEAALQENWDMPSCEDLDKIYKPSIAFNKRINKIILRQEKRESARRTFYSFGRITAVFSVIVVAISLALLTVEASRNFIFNTFINIRSDHAVIKFGEGASLTQVAVYDFGYVPQDFELIEIQSAGNIQIKIYANSNGEQIIFEYSILDVPVIGVDTENTEYTRIIVNGYEAFLFSTTIESGFNVLTWATESAVFKLTSSIESDELVKVAEGVIKN